MPTPPSPESDILHILSHYHNQKHIITDEELYRCFKLMLDGINPLLNPQFINTMQQRADPKKEYYDVTNHAAFRVSHNKLKHSLLERLVNGKPLLSTELRVLSITERP